MDILFVDYDVDDIVIMGEKSVLRGLDMIFSMLFVMFLWGMLEYVVVNKKRVIFMNILF